MSQNVQCVTARLRNSSIETASVFTGSMCNFTRILATFTTNLSSKHRSALQILTSPNSRWMVDTGYCRQSYREARSCLQSFDRSSLHLAITASGYLLTRWVQRLAR
jgi:hypothetical protein